MPPIHPKTNTGVNPQQDAPPTPPRGEEKAGYGPHQTTGSHTTTDGQTVITTATMADAAKIISGVEYLIQDWVPKGMITGLIAQPGVGKSALALWLARAVLLGENYFNGQRAQKGKVLWIDTENTMAITIQRMKDWNIPLDDNMLLPFPYPLDSVDLTNPVHLARIHALLAGFEPSLVVVDSLRGCHGGNENSSDVMAGVMKGINSISEATGVATLVVHHTRKLAIDEEITANSSRGSNASQALMRSQLGIDQPDPQNPRMCRLQLLKENLGTAPTPIGFEVTPTGLIFFTAPTRPKQEKGLDTAITALLEVLPAGEWVAASEVLDELKTNYGLSVATIQRAKHELGIVKPNHIRKVKSGWEWHLPAPGQHQETASPGR